MKGLKESLQRVYKILEALVRLIPTVLEILEDLADDGKRNNSNRGTA